MIRSTKTNINKQLRSSTMKASPTIFRFLDKIQYNKTNHNYNFFNFLYYSIFCFLFSLINLFMNGHFIREFETENLIKIKNYNILNDTKNQFVEFSVSIQSLLLDKLAKEYSYSVNFNNSNSNIGDFFASKSRFVINIDSYNLDSYINKEFSSKVNQTEIFLCSEFFQNYFIFKKTNLEKIYYLTISIFSANAVAIVVISLICFIKSKKWKYFFYVISFICGINNMLNFQILRNYFKVEKLYFHLEFSFPILNTGLLIFYYIIMDSNKFINTGSYIVASVLLYIFDLGTNWELNSNYIFLITGIFSIIFLNYYIEKKKQKHFLILEKTKKDLEKTKNLVKNLNSGLLVFKKDFSYDFNKKYTQIIQTDILKKKSFYEYVNKISLFTRITELSKGLDDKLIDFFNKFKSIFNEIENELKNNISKTNFFEGKFKNANYYQSNNPTSNISKSIIKNQSTLYLINKGQKGAINKTKTLADDSQHNKNKIINKGNFSVDENKLNFNYADSLADNFRGYIEEQISFFIKFLFENVKFNQFNLLGNVKVKNFSSTLTSESLYQIYMRNNDFNESIEFLIYDITSVIQVEDFKAQNKYKKMFLNKFSHEFRNPILNITQLCKNIKNSVSNFDDESEKNLDHIKNICNYMSMLISDFDYVANCNISSNKADLYSDNLTIVNDNKEKSDSNRNKKDEDANHNADGTMYACNEQINSKGEAGDYQNTNDTRVMNYNNVNNKFKRNNKVNKTNFNSESYYNSYAHLISNRINSNHNNNFAAINHINNSANVDLRNNKNATNINYGFTNIPSNIEENEKENINDEEADANENLVSEYRLNYILNKNGDEHNVENNNDNHYDFYNVNENNSKQNNNNDTYEIDENKHSKKKEHNINNNYNNGNHAIETTDVISINHINPSSGCGGFSNGMSQKNITAAEEAEILAKKNILDYKNAQIINTKSFIINNSKSNLKFQTITKKKVNPNLFNDHSNLISTINNNISSNNAVNINKFNEKNNSNNINNNNKHGHIDSAENSTANKNRIEINFNSNSNQIDKTRFDIYKMIRSQIKIFQSKIIMSEKFIKLDYNIDSSIPAKITHDQCKIKQIIFNLLSNAVKFTNNGTIFLGVLPEENNLELIITDTGIGIKKEIIPLLGQPFFKTENLNNSYGIGMGLHIVKNHTEALNGEFTILSDFGNGTTATVKIPLDPYKSLNNVSIHEQTFLEKYDYDLFNSTILNKNEQEKIRIQNKIFNSYNNKIINKLKTFKPFLSKEINDKYQLNPEYLMKSIGNLRFNQVQKNNLKNAENVNNPNKLTNYTCSNTINNLNNLNTIKTLNFNKISPNFITNDNTFDLNPNSHKSLISPNNNNKNNDFQLTNLNNSITRSKRNVEKEKYEKHYIKVKKRRGFKTLKIPFNRRMISNSSLLNNLKNTNSRINEGNFNNNSIINDISAGSTQINNKLLNFYYSDVYNSDSSIDLKNSKASGFNIVELKNNNKYNNLNRFNMLSNNPVSSPISWHKSPNSRKDNFKAEKENPVKLSLEGNENNFNVDSNENYFNEPKGHINSINDKEKNNPAIFKDEKEKNYKAYMYKKLTLAVNKTDLTDINTSTILFATNNNLSDIKQSNNINSSTNNQTHNLNQNANIFNQEDNLLTKLQNFNKNNLSNISSYHNSFIPLNPNDANGKGKSDINNNNNHNNMNRNNNPNSNPHNNINNNKKHEDNINTHTNVVSEDFPSENIFRILVVDDERLIRQSEINVLKKFFKINNIFYEIEECTDGVECLYRLYCGIITGKKYRMILTDETMNFMKGTTMANIIRKLINENILYDIKIYMITSYESSTVTVNKKGDIRKIFTKPLSISTLETIFMIEDEHDNISFYDD